MAAAEAAAGAEETVKYKDEMETVAPRLPATRTRLPGSQHSLPAPLGNWDQRASRLNTEYYIQL